MMEGKKLLHRQIHPNFIKNNSVSVQAFEVTSQAFQPFPKDEGLLSVVNENYFTAKESFHYYTSNLKLQSKGTLSISRKECAEIDLSVEDDNNPFEGHSSINMKDLSKAQIKKRASKLKEFAIQRGWQYLN